MGNELKRLTEIPGPAKRIRITSDRPLQLGIKVSHTCKKAKKEVELELTRETRCPHCGTIFQLDVPT